MRQNTRYTYNWILQQMRIADNAMNRAYQEAYEDIFIPKEHMPYVSFATLFIYASNNPEAYYAACKTRLEKRRIDPLPVSDRKYFYMMVNKRHAVEFGDIPF